MEPAGSHLRPAAKSRAHLTLPTPRVSSRHSSSYFAIFSSKSRLLAAVTFARCLKYVFLVSSAYRCRLNRFIRRFRVRVLCQINAMVEGRGGALACTHFDAFRFFTPEAK